MLANHDNQADVAERLRERAPRHGGKGWDRIELDRCGAVADNVQDTETDGDAIGTRMGTSGRNDAVVRDTALANTFAALLGASPDPRSATALASMRGRITNRNVLKPTPSTSSSGHRKFLRLDRTSTSVISDTDMLALAVKLGTKMKDFR